MAKDQGWGLGELVANKMGVNAGAPPEPVGSVVRVQEIEGVFVGEPGGVNVGVGVGEGVPEIEGVFVGEPDGVNVGVGVGEGVPEIESVFEREPDGVKVGVGDGEGQIRVICLMRLLLLSPMYRVPAEFTVTPNGELKREAVPKPSRKEPVEPPAIVVTTPRGVIMRIRLLE